MNAIVTSVPQSVVEQARHDLVKGISKTGDLINNYATGLSMGFNLVAENGELIKAWYELRGKDAKGIKAERAKFAEEMKEAGYEQGTIDVYWQRVKVASGYQTTGMRVKAQDTLDAKTFSELKTILNRILASEDDSEGSEKSQLAKPFLMKAFEAMGGDSTKDLK